MKFAKRILSAVLPALIVVMLVGAVNAQSILGLTSGTTQAETSEQTTQVIIIDKTGKVTVTDSTALAPTMTETPSEPAGSTLMKAQMRGAEFREKLTEKLASLPVVFNEVEYILKASSPTGDLSAFTWTVAYMALFLLAGYIFETRIFGRYIAKDYVVSRIKEAPEGYLEKLPFLVMRFFAGVIGAIISIVVAYLVGWIVFGSPEDSAIEFTVTAIISAYFGFRVISLVWRMVLSPFLCQYRIPFFSDRDAKRLFYWLNACAFVGISVDMFATWIQEISLNDTAYGLALIIGTAIVALMNLLMIAVNKRAITCSITGGLPSDELSVNSRLVAGLWAPVAVVYILSSVGLMIWVGALETDIAPPLIAGAYSALMAAFVVYGIAGYLIERYQVSRTSLMLQEADAEDEDQPDDIEDVTEGETAQGSASRYHIHTWQELAFRVAGIIALACGLWAGLAVWDVSPELLESSFFGRLIDVAFVLLFGYVVYQAFRIWVDNKIAEETPDTGEAELGDEGGQGSASRLGTLLPLFRNTILVIIAITIFLIVLLELGINVTPLFAGAGVVGIAVGFGAQTLVRDVFSGAFFLIDDAFRKGEYIDVGDVKGTVEAISVRSFKLRHHLGPLHTIPFGEIKSLTNYSRDWVIMKLKLRLTYDTDVEKVRKLVKKLGQELLEDPEIGQDFLQPLKSQGVIEMQDSAMIVRVKFMTKPGDQWMVRKKVYQEIRALFEREGIKFANREVTVHIADSRAPGAPPLTEEQKKAIAGAALDVDEELEVPGGGDDR